MKKSFWLFKKISAFALLFFVLLGVVGKTVSYSKEKDLHVSDNDIHIAMALDDGYLYPTIVTITSVMENSNSEEKYNFHIMHPLEFSEDNKTKLKSIEKKYQNCSIDLINMGNQFKNAKSSARFTTPTYYRLALSKLLPNVLKIIWIDGDVLAFSDIKSMYEINMKKFHYKGFLDWAPKYLNRDKKNFGVENKNYICAGVMCINLEQLRLDKMFEKYIKFINKNNSKLAKHDQTVINVMSHKKNGILPAKYGIFKFSGFNVPYDEAEYVTDPQLEKYQKRLVSPKKYSLEELKEALQKPCVVHCVGRNKLWNSSDKQDVYVDLWWQYAKKTDFFEEIKQKFSTCDKSDEIIPK